MRTFSVGIAILIALGCGGAGHHLLNTGNIHVLIDWPDTTRVLPTYAKSVTCTLDSWSGPNISEISNRAGTSSHRTSVHFRNVTRQGNGDPNYIVELRAFSDTDGRGVEVARADVPVRFRSGDDGAQLNFDVLASAALRTSISRFEVTGPHTVSGTAPVQMIGRALDTENRTLLLPEGVLRWTITEGQTLASITASGMLTPIGTGRIRVTLQEIDGIVPPLHHYVDLSN